MTQKVRACEKNIKEISSIPNSLMSKTEQIIKDNIIINLSNKIQDFMTFVKIKKNLQNNYKR